MSDMAINRWLTMVSGVLLLSITSGWSDSLTVTLTTNVVVRGVMPLGLNIGDSTYDAPTRRKRWEKNFEGVVYRQIHPGLLYSNGFASIYGSTNQYETKGWYGLYPGAAWQLVSDSGAVRTGVVASVSPRYVVTSGTNAQWSPFFDLGRSFPEAGATNLSGVGLLIERWDLTSQGHLGARGNYWISGNCEPATNQPAPGSFGTTSLRLNGSSSNATYRTATFPSHLADLGTGSWTVAFWHRVESSSPTLQVVSRFSGTQPVTTSGAWAYTQQVWTVASRGNSEDREEFVLTVSGGSVLVDDVEVWQNSETNGTAYRTDFVELMRSFNVGLLRQLQMGGAGLSNMLYPPLRQHAYAYSQYTQTGPYGNAQRSPYGIHEFLQLCEAVGAEAWLNLPGVLHTNEVAQFMEYLAGPTNAGWGRIRAELGHPAPWTDGRPVNIEFGNEAWNLDWSFLYGGFNGTNYWRRLVSAGKASPYYHTNILFHAAGQNFDASAAKRILRDVTNADHYAIAPYALQSVTTNDLAALPTEDLRFGWMLNYPLYDLASRMTVHNELITNGTEYSIYEFNYHTTTGDGPVDQRNAFLTSKAAGLSVANASLLFLKDYGIRRQCLFTLNQESFSIDGGPVRLWGTVLGYKPGNERFRPHWLATLAANQVRRGDLVQTVHSSNVVHAVVGRFSSSDSASVVTNTYPALFSHGFRDGTTNGLVLANYSLTETQTVQLVFGEAASHEQATSWLLSSPSPTNHNEWTSSVAQVTLVETTLTTFVSGSSLDIPPASLRVLRWKSAAPGEDFRAPEIADLDPAPGTTNAEPSHALQITFNEKVNPGGGAVHIHTASNGTPVFTLSATGDFITVDGQTVSIAPPTNLAYATAYYVLVASNAFHDLAGNAFTGIVSTSTWAFTTRHYIPPTTNILRVDFGLTNAPVETDGSWQAFAIPYTTSSKATNLTFSMGTATVAVSVGGPSMSGRDRGNPASDSGALTYSSVYRDLFQATGIMTVQVSGLRGDAPASLRVWMYDYTYAQTNLLSVTDVTDGRSDLLGIVTNRTGSGFAPTTNTAYSVGAEIWASTGGGLTLLLSGNSGASRLNGMELVQIFGDVPPQVKTLDVSAPAGASLPAAGSHVYNSGARIMCVITNNPLLLGTSQLVCTGWTGTGSVPSSGSGTTVTFTLVNNSTITWLWQTNYQLGIGLALNGSVAGGGWYAAGSTATVSATALPGYQFVGWSGDVPASQTNDNPLTLSMTQPRTITANIAASGPVSTNNHRIVDFGGKIGSGYYRNDPSPNAYPALVDQDNNGTLTNDTVMAWIFSLTNPLNAPGLEFDTNSPSGVFYGGLTTYAVNEPVRTLDEGMVNQNHEFYDDLNMMGYWNTNNVRSPLFKAFGVWLWQKQNFLNGADDYMVRFDTNSTISVHISRYWGGVNAGRWLVRDGDQFYLSQATFGGKTNQYDLTTTNRVSDPGHGAANPVLRTTHILNPPASLWAPYNPGGAPGTNDDFEIAFDSDAAVFSAHTFSNVTAAGFFVERKLSPPQTVSSGLPSYQPFGVKWNAFQCTAVVERPDYPSFYQETVDLNGDAFSIGINPVSYALWRNVFRSSQRRSSMNDLPSRTYSFERDGAMGSMRADDLAHAESEPVADISWLDAIAFCNGLSELEGVQPCYYSDAAMTNVLRIVVDRDMINNWTARSTVYWNTNAAGFRLPTATEWEQLPAGLRSATMWEYVWSLPGNVADPAQQRTVRSWTLTAPTSSVMRFSERPWQGSPRIGFRIVRNGTSAPDLSAPSGGSAAWSFATNTVLAPMTNLTSDEVRSLASQLYSLVPLTVSLAAQAGSSDTNFIPTTVFPNAPEVIGFGATEIPFKLWNLVQGWGRDNGYGFNYDGDMGSMGNAPSSAVHTNMEPVTEITLYDTYAWCNAYSELMGRTPVYYLDGSFTQVYRQANLFRLETLKRASSPNWPGGPVQPYDTAALIPVYMNASANGYRIPLPQEWDLANTTDANSATDAYNWLIGNSGGKTQPVGTKLPNPVGLYDMEGNVLELTWGDPKKNINNAPWRMGSHFARVSQIGKSPFHTSEFAGVGRAHVGFRILTAIANFSLIANTNHLVVPEGASASFTLALSARPDATVTVSVARVSGDADLALAGPATYTFTTGNWAMAQSVTIAAAEDADGVGGVATFQALAEDVPTVSITVNEVDNDGSFTVSPSTLSFTWSASSGSATTTLLNTGFEGTYALPSGWTQQWLAGQTSVHWLIQRGGSTGGNNPSAAHGGSNNACLYYGGRSNVTRLASPVFSSGNATSLVLSFWHTQPYWSPDQDKLRVQVRTNGSAWTSLAYYSNNVAIWTLRTLAVPSGTSVQLAFDGTATDGYGACLDDIALTAYGPAASGMPGPQSFTVSNSGPTTMVLTNFWSAPWLAVQPATTTLASGASATFIVGLASNSLQPGAMTATVWVVGQQAAQGPMPVTVAFSIDTNLPSHPLAVSATKSQWGSVNTTGGLYLAGCPVTLVASSSLHGVHGGWTGTVTDTVNPLVVTMDGPHTITALFGEKLYTNSTPSIWLAGHALPTSDAGALSDTDADGMPAWEEFIANTQPTNASSRLAALDVRLQAGTPVIHWSAASGRVYSIHWCAQLPDGFTSASPETASSSYTDTVHGTQTPGYYRIGVRLAP